MATPLSKLFLNTAHRLGPVGLDPAGVPFGDSQMTTIIRNRIRRFLVAMDVPGYWPPPPPDAQVAAFFLLGLGVGLLLLPVLARFWK